MSKDLNFIKSKCISYKFYKKIKDLDVLIITVPTPLNKNKTPDLKAIEDVLIKIQPFIKGQSIILESTVYPGTT